MQSASIIYHRRVLAALDATYYLTLFLRLLQNVGLVRHLTVHRQSEMHHLVVYWMDQTCFADCGWFKNYWAKANRSRGTNMQIKITWGQLSIVMTHARLYGVHSSHLLRVPSAEAQGQNVHFILDMPTISKRDSFRALINICGCTLSSI
jgi:hypothetical protein